MMTSSNGHIFRISGPLCGEFTGHQLIPLTKASDGALLFSFINARINGLVNKETLVFWDAIELIMTSL